MEGVEEGGVGTAKSYTETKRMKGYETEHEVIIALENGVATGNFKPCSHLKYALSGTAFEVIRMYFPVCERDSFVSRDPFGRDMGCAADCRLYVNRTVAIAAENELHLLRERAKRRRLFWNRVGKIVGAPFVYFRSLPALVQSLLIILLIVWKLPSLKTTIIEILRAISGKP